MQLSTLHRGGNLFRTRHAYIYIRLAGFLQKIFFSPSLALLVIFETTRGALYQLYISSWPQLRFNKVGSRFFEIGTRPKAARMILSRFVFIFFAGPLKIGPRAFGQSHSLSQVHLFLSSRCTLRIYFFLYMPLRVKEIQRRARQHCQIRDRCVYFIRAALLMRSFYNFFSISCI